MINLTKDIQIILCGNELSEAVIRSISRAKNCIQHNFFSGKHISVSNISTSKNNPLHRASIFKFFEGHDDPDKAPDYDEKWVIKLHNCCYATKNADFVSPLLPVGENGLSWINRTYLNAFKTDAILLIHYLWVEGAVLLPMGLKLPTSRNVETGGQSFEYAAYEYPETLALVRKPFVTHIELPVPDIRASMPGTAVENFGWYAWRLIRATNWFKIEDIIIDDAVDLIALQQLTRSKKEDFYRYPISPKTLLTYISELFPQRCQYNPADSNLINSAKLATKSAINSGMFYIPDDLQGHFDLWTKYQNRYIQSIKSRGMKSLKAINTSLGTLNGYLFDRIVSTAGIKHVPKPSEFSRKHIEGHDGIPAFSEFVRKKRKSSTVKTILYKISHFFDYLESSSTSEPELDGFKNPIIDIDFPYVPRQNSTSKKIFTSEHFLPLLQYVYAVEAFGWYLSQAIHYENFQLGRNASTHRKIYDTSEYGFIPVIFLENPSSDSNHGKVKTKKLQCIPLHFIPKKLLPLIPRKSKNKKSGYVTYPLITHVQQTIIALETGIRNIHIRWLDRRTYDQNIDRSRRIESVCDLWVNTDKTHGAWAAKVSDNVIKVIDRQIETHDWFDEPSIHKELWYDYHEDSDFGQILTVFPRGLAAGLHQGELPGPFTGHTHREYFKKLIFSFDMFCRYSLGISPCNQMHEKFASIESLETIEDYASALKLMNKGLDLIEHSPHSCRASVVSEYIRILPPNIIGDYITGHSTVAHVIYYAKCDPEYLYRHKEFQKIAFDNGYEWDESLISHSKAEDINSKLRKAFQKDRTAATVDFGATSFDRSTDTEIYSGIRALKEQPLDSIAFFSTHICPFGSRCPNEIIKDFNAIPGQRTPCGSCYYSVKTVDHLPRITGHIRSLTDECAELEQFIKEAKQHGASPEALKAKDEHRKYLANEIMSWAVTVHCLEQMYQDIKSRNHFLIAKPEIVSDQLERVVVEDHTFESLLARIAEAKSHAEFFTPQLKYQVKAARNKLLAFTNNINSLMQQEPSGFQLIDEFRGLIRTTCETLGVTVKELANELGKPMKLQKGGSQNTLKLISEVRKSDNA